MQDEWNNCYTPPTKETGTDISSTNKSRTDNDNSDNDISESESSLQEEAVLPETDHVNLGCPRKFGYTKIY